MTVTAGSAPGLLGRATVQERSARGKAVRGLVARGAHADVKCTQVPLLELDTATDGERMKEPLPAEADADRVESQHQQLQRAVADGVLPVAPAAAGERR